MTQRKVPSTHQLPHTRPVVFPSWLSALIGTCVLGISVNGCSPSSKNGTSSTAPATERETRKQTPTDVSTDSDAAPPTTREATTTPTTTQSSPPILQSEYDPTPPYTVKLYVRDPEAKQPGWLKIMELADTSALATSVGTFPERNRIYVDTENVTRIRIHIDQLPLAPNTRIVLQIDDQPMELVRKERTHVYLERQSNGSWQTVTPKKGE